MKKAILLLAMLTLTNLFAHAQTPEWVNYTNGENILAIAEEGQYLWVGTQGGLVKIDKQNGSVQYFDKTNSDLPDNYVTAIAIDIAGNKWIGIRQGGLAKFDNTDWVIHYPMGTSLPHANITCLLVHANLLWVGTDGSGFASYDGALWQYFNSTVFPSAPWQINSVRSMAIDQNNKIWIGGYAALIGFDFNSWEIYDASYNPDFPGGSVSDIKVDINNNKWLAIGNDPDGAIAKFDDIQMQFWKTADGLPDPNVRRLQFDQAGTLWLGSNGGLSTFDGATFGQTYTIADGLPADLIYSLYIDADDYKWIGAFHYWDGGGLVRLDQSGAQPIWQYYNTSSSGLPHNLIGAIYKAFNGYVWVGTNNGVARFDGLNWIKYDYNNTGHSLYVVNAIAEDAQGTLWIATQGAGVFTFDGTSVWGHFDQNNSILDSDAIYDIKIDQSGKIWMATGNGLFTLDNQGNWFKYTTGNSGLPDNWTWTIAFDQAGNTWVGTFNAGLAKFDNNGNWFIYNTGSGLLNNRINTIAFNNNLVWVGTNNGAASFNGTSFTTYTSTTSGLPNNTVRSITADLNGDLWMGTFGGLAKYEPNNNSWTVMNMFNSFLADDWIRKVVIDNFGNKWIGTWDGGMSVYNQGGIVSVQENQIGNKTDALSNLHAYPNPFNSTTTIHYKLEEAGQVLIAVTNLSGQLVDVILHENKAAGDYKIAWDASLHVGGIYFCTVQGKDFRQTKKLVLLNQ
jgi:ligand-binding sensor domain-containing protein